MTQNNRKLDFLSAVAKLEAIVLVIICFIVIPPYLSGLQRTQ